MESSSRSRSLRSVAVMLMLTLLVLIGLNHFVGRANADISSSDNGLSPGPQSLEAVAGPGRLDPSS